MAEGPRKPIWLQVADDPATFQMEKTVAEAHELERAHNQAEIALTDYYWNSGTPYTTHPGRPGGDAMWLSFHWDKPVESAPTEHMKRLAVGRGGVRYTNDLEISFDHVRSSGMPGVLFGRASSQPPHGFGREGDTFLLSERTRQVISPGYANLVYRGGNDFEIVGGPAFEGPVLHVLTPQERTETNAKRDHLEALEEARGSILDAYATTQDIRVGIARAILAAHGSAIEDESRSDSVLVFRHGGKYVQMGSGGSMTKVMTWDERLNFDQRHVLWRAWDEQRTSPIIDVPSEEYFSSGLDRFLDPKSGLENGVDIDGEWVSINADVFKRAFGFLDFAIDSPHASWNVPIALGIIDADIGDAADMTDPELGSSRILTALGPGLFKPRSDDRGTVEGVAMPPDPVGRRQQLWKLGSNDEVRAVDNVADLRAHPGLNSRARLAHVHAEASQRFSNLQRSVQQQAPRAQGGLAI